ncbi:hypothetical protein NIB75_02875 [Bacteroides uniformis]|nr:hypothetical protein [Bacteroides uniformis]
MANALSGQLEAVSPYVDKVLCYQYLGIMNKPRYRYCGRASGFYKII